jgi:hypothetical protein
VVVVNDQHRVRAGLLDLLAQDPKSFSASGEKAKGHARLFQFRPQGLPVASDQWG